ncbi:unnamed protein product [Microthlaspi erraticum]|uniref:Uncharacterized protein n=1 Tax=Microthlaspi erraticum TaxID=1685480 RepID=A0A6D2KNW8_9BRAS|nr:unnamed protein product [Microthlaspi erraticum]
MTGALFKNVASRLIRRNAAADRTGLALFDVRRLQSRPYFRLNQLFGRAKETRISHSSGFCSSSSTSSSSFASVRFVGWYLGMVKSRPVFTKSVTCSLIYIAADMSSQTISKTSSESYDLVRTARMAGYGLFVLGPTLHYWFNFMSRLFPKRDLITTFKKMAMGQTIYGPTMTVIFFSLNASLRN